MKTKANWLDSTTTAENEILPKYVKWAWSTRAVSLAINVIFIMQLTYYCTDILMMPTLMVGTLLLVSKIFDGFTDLIVGFIIDKTNTKLGKARPYEIFIVLVWLFTIMLYSTPEIGITGKAVWVFILYSLINSICATFLNGADAVYLARSVRSEKNRVSLMSFNGAFVMLGSISVSMLLPQLIAGIGMTKRGWTMIALMIGVPCALIGMLRFVFVKEVSTEKPKTLEKAKAGTGVSLKEGLKCLVKNKYIFMLAAMTFLIQLQTNMNSAVNTYYFKYVIGDIGLASLISMTSILTPVFLIVFPVLSKKFGSTNLLRASAVIGVAGFIVRIIGGINIPLLIVGSILITVSSIPISIMISIYLIDCMDYGEWKTGIRIEGIMTSVNSFTSKLGSGIASGLVGLVMGVCGYNGTLDVQPASAILSINALFNYIPLLLTVVFAVFAFMYRIDRHLAQIKADQGAKRTN
ncbi:MAG: glycoside-pentoside-hexuronide (GPH):cation symporter [Lachnospiraceae bacterium]|nr:glycoside-pentoside-hexuronide (GPH):cation symporter [Lachnospiraceae bacterium]